MKYICIEVAISIIREMQINIGDTILVLDENYYKNSILIYHYNSGYKLSVTKLELVNNFTTKAELRDKQIDSILED